MMVFHEKSATGPDSADPNTPGPLTTDRSRVQYDPAPGALGLGLAPDDLGIIT